MTAPLGLRRTPPPSPSPDPELGSSERPSAASPDQRKQGGRSRPSPAQIGAAYLVRSCVPLAGAAPQPLGPQRTLPSGSLIAVTRGARTNPLHASAGGGSAARSVSAWPRRSSGAVEPHVSSSHAHRGASPPLLNSEEAKTLKELSDAYSQAEQLTQELLAQAQQLLRSPGPSAPLLASGSRSPPLPEKRIAPGRSRTESAKQGGRSGDLQEALVPPPAASATLVAPPEAAVKPPTEDAMSRQAAVASDSKLSNSVVQSDPALTASTAPLASSSRPNSAANNISAAAMLTMDEANLLSEALGELDSPVAAAI